MKNIQSKKTRNFKSEEFQYLPKYAVYVWFNLDLVKNDSNLWIQWFISLIYNFETTRFISLFSPHIQLVEIEWSENEQKVCRMRDWRHWESTSEESTEAQASTHDFSWHEKTRSFIIETSFRHHEKVVQNVSHEWQIFHFECKHWSRNFQSKNIQYFLTLVCHFYMWFL